MISDNNIISFNIFTNRNFTSNQTGISSTLPTTIQVSAILSQKGFAVSAALYQTGVKISESYRYQKNSNILVSAALYQTGVRCTVPDR